MGACGSSAQVVGQQKLKLATDPTWTSLEDVLQEQRRIEREGFKLMEEGINQYRKVRFRGIDSVPIDLLYLLLVSIGILYFMTLYNYK